MSKFENKVVLLGGNLGRIKEGQFKPGLSGIIAKQLVAEGAQVIVVDVDFAVADACAKAIGGKIKAVACDLVKDRISEKKVIETEKGPKEEIVWTDNPALNLVQDIVKEFGKVDVLITNFDSYEQVKVDKTDDAIYQSLYEQNITPTFHLLAAVREQFAGQTKANGTYAKVVMITSMVGKAGLSMGALYAAFKASIVSLVKGLAREYGRFANVNGVAYGPFSDKNLQGPKDRIKKNYVSTASDMSNQDITPEKVAPAVLFLASDDAMGISGQTLSVDGGLWLKLEQ
jgi:NAD(P)-dependent dehydrogenase (short-subunit alcohol dehydrogenase family)